MLEKKPGSRTIGGVNEIPGFCWFFLWVIGFYRRRNRGSERSVGLMRSPVSVGFIQRLVDYVGEETGDQNDRFCGGLTRSPVSVGFV